MSNVKHEKRLKRAKRTRKHIRELQTENPNIVMATVFKSNQHIYVNGVIFDAVSGQSKVLVCASSVEKAIKDQHGTKTGNVDTAKAVGKLFGERLQAVNQPDLRLAFDRSGYKYHGRVKALADAIREVGIEF